MRAVRTSSVQTYTECLVGKLGRSKGLLTRKQLRKLERREERELQREQRMSRRLAKRPAKELLPDFKLLFHPPVEMGQDYLIIAELYRPSGEGGDGESGSAPITIGGGKNASGFDHFHTLIAAVDKRTGAFSWQTSFGPLPRKRPHDFRSILVPPEKRAPFPKFQPFRRRRGQHFEEKVS